MHTALAAWVAVLAAALGQSEPAPCASSFALESHAGAAHHGDVCRGPKGAWQCPRGCATSATAWTLPGALRAAADVAVVGLAGVGLQGER